MVADACGAPGGVAAAIEGDAFFGAQVDGVGALFDVYFAQQVDVALQRSHINVTVGGNQFHPRLISKQTNRLAGTGQQALLTAHTAQAGVPSAGNGVVPATVLLGAALRACLNGGVVVAQAITYKLIFSMLFEHQ